MKTLITTFIISLLVTLPAQADTTDDVLNQLTIDGVMFSYSTGDKTNVGQSINLLRTRKTTEKVDVAIQTLEEEGIAYTVTNYVESFEDAAAEAEIERRRTERQDIGAPRGHGGGEVDANVRSKLSRAGDSRPGTLVGGVDDVLVRDRVEHSDGHSACERNPTRGDRHVVWEPAEVLGREGRSDRTQPIDLVLERNERGSCRSRSEHRGEGK